MTDVFDGFLVIIERADGRRGGSLAPDELRAASGCPRTAFLADCIEQYNARQVHEGAEDRARLEMRTQSSKRRKFR